MALATESVSSKHVMASFLATFPNPRLALPARLFYVAGLSGLGGWGGCGPPGFGGSNLGGRLLVASLPPRTVRQRVESAAPSNSTPRANKQTSCPPRFSNLRAAFLRHCVGTIFLHSVVCSMPPCHFSHKSLSLEARKVSFFPFYFFGVVGVVCMVFRVVGRFENLEGQAVIKGHLIE